MAVSCFRVLHRCGLRRSAGCRDRGGLPDRAPQRQDRLRVSVPRNGVCIPEGRVRGGGAPFRDARHHAVRDSRIGNSPVIAADAARRRRAGVKKETAMTTRKRSALPICILRAARLPLLAGTFAPLAAPPAGVAEELTFVPKGKSTGFVPVLPQSSLPCSQSPALVRGLPGTMESSQRRGTNPPAFWEQSGPLLLKSLLQRLSLFQEVPRAETGNESLPSAILQYLPGAPRS